MNRIDRLLGILTYLQSKRYVTAGAIADKFGISVRTVYRDVKALCEQGIPVSFEPNKGYFIMQEYFLPPVSFTTDEANAMLLMETLVRGFADKSIRDNYSSALNKIKAGLRLSQKESIELLSNNIKLQIPECFNADYEYLSAIQNAVARKNVLQISYNNTKGETTQRTVEPIGLVFYALNWHLIAWCALRKDYRDFRVSRITGLHNNQQPFTQARHIELNEYMKQLPVNY